MMRMSRLTRTDQKFGSVDLSMRWTCRPGRSGSLISVNAVSCACFCSSLASLAREAMKLSARMVGMT